MKQLSLVFLLCCLTVIGYAQSQLRVHLTDNSRINVSVNGRYFDRRGTTVTVGDLPPGRHYVKIFRTTYDQRGRYFDRLVYQGTVRTSNGMITNFMMNPLTRRVSIRTNPIEMRPGYRSQQPPSQSHYYYDERNKDEQQDMQPDNRNEAPVAEEQPAAAPLPEGVPAASPVPEGSFSDDEVAFAKKKVAARKTDTEKLKYLKDVLKKETVTTIQVGDMMDWFMFESSKLDFAKWAYHITTDQEFYPDLASKFRYNSSKEELESFLNSKK